jgi:hypothetical protein
VVAVLAEINCRRGAGRAAADHGDVTRVCVHGCPRIPQAAGSGC